MPANETAPSTGPGAADRPEVLTAARLWPPMMQALHGAFRVHERLHETDAVAFAAIIAPSSAPRAARVPMRLRI